MDWWYGLTLLQQVYFCIAVPATLILLIQTVLAIFGGDADADVDVDIADASLTPFLFRGVIAFFAIGGWTGLCVGAASLDTAWVILISVAAGALAASVVILLLRSAMKLKESGNLDYANAVGKTAKVYLMIPPQRKGAGKVTLTLQDRFVEAEAVTDDDEALDTGETVTVRACLDDTTLLVTGKENP